MPDMRLDGWFDGVVGALRNRIENPSRRDVLQNLSSAGGRAEASVTELSEADEVLVGVDRRGPAADVALQAREHIETIDLGHVRQIVHGRFSSEALAGLRRNPTVRYIEPNLRKYHAIAQTLPWGIDRVDADVVHGSGETGDGADIAIIDTGIDDDHEDLQANVGAGKAFVDCSGSNCNHAWSDDENHGTHCAGIADAVDNTTGVVGVAMEATLHAVKVLDSDGSGYLSDVANGIKYVADQGWDVGSLSLGAPSGDQSLQDACQYAYDNGVLLVGATGNDGPCSDCVSYPAAYATVIAVTSTDEDDSLSDFSSTGPEVELAAPGGSINSTVIGGYDTHGGTSMACPHVSGAGGQLMANGYTNTEARDRLLTTAEDIGLGDNEQGHGLLDAETAILEGFLVRTLEPTNVDSSSATLHGSLDDLDGADSATVHFDWRETGSSTWNATASQTLTSTTSFSADVSGLTEGAEYEYRAVGEASDGETDTGSTRTFTASDCVDATRWAAGTGQTGNEHITTMDLDGQVLETSSDDAYYDFSCPEMVSVKRGDSFDVTMEFEDAGYNDHYGNVYVDWAADGSWSNAAETQIMAGVSEDSVAYTATVDVPSDATTGGTLARVRLSFGQFYGPTATGEYGEVEDFTIFVTEGISVSASGEKDVPAGGEATISMSAEQVETIRIEKLWTDWTLASTSPDGGSVSDDIADDGKVTISYGSIQASVSPSITVSLPSRYVDGSYLLDVTATNSNGGNADTDAVLTIA
jgi:subtilisin